MKVAEIKIKAKEMGISAGKMSKKNLILKIQETEGNFTCFGTAASGFCDQVGCVWKNDCLSIK